VTVKHGETAKEENATVDNAGGGGEKNV